MVGPCGHWEPVVLKAPQLEMLLLASCFLEVILAAGSHLPPIFTLFFSSFSSYKQSLIPSLAMYCPAVSAMDMLVLPK